MSFRLVFTLITAVAMLLGCAGENEFTSPPVIRFDSPKYQCLSNADEIMKKFIEAQLSPAELGAFWDCVDTAVVKFVKFVRGSEGQNYTPTEIAKFLDDFFLDQRGLPEEKELIAEMMEVKRLLLGGSIYRISYQDLFVRTRELIQEFKQMTLLINPHMKALRGTLIEKDAGLQAAEVTAATQALKVTGAHIASLMKKGRYFYSFSHLQALVTQIEKFIQKREPDFNLDTAKKYLPLLSEFKGLMVSPPYDLIKNEDWARLFESMTNIVGWGVQYSFYIEKQEWDHGTPFEMLATIVTGALDEIDKGLGEQENNEFSFVDLDRVMDRLGNLELLPLDIDGKTAKAVIRRIAERVLDPQSGEGTGLNRGDFAALRQEINRWLDAQRYINREIIKGIDLEAAEISDSGSEIRMLMRTRWPMLVDTKSRLVFSPETYAGRYDRKSLTALNWQRALMRGLMRGYAKQTSQDGATGLTSDEMVTLAQDWHALAEKMGLFEPGDGEKIAKKIFMEANLFMPSSNGDEHLDFIEGVQYLSFAISGMHSSSDIGDAIKDLCQMPEDKSKYAAACVREQLFEQREKLLGNLPLLLSFVDSNKARWRQFEGMIEVTTRDAVTDTPFSKGDLIEMMVLMHYIETFFASHDSDKNHQINVDETLEAFPAFRRSLKEIVKTAFGVTMGTDDLKGLFTFLFKYGKPPQTTFGGVVKFLNWRWNPDTWEYEADRLRVIQILSELNSRR